MITIKEIFPIKGRSDFSKFVVLNDGVILRGWQGNKKGVELHFDSKEEAQPIADALEAVEKRNKEFLEDDGFEPTKNY
jgi:hypothetical protein